MFKKCLVMFCLLNVACFANFEIELKETDLISDMEINKVNFFDEKRKSLSEKKIYKKNFSILSRDEIKIYKIFDRILRANNLLDKNYRIAFNNDKDIINAISLNNNLIIINTSLYDCIHQNDDALAFVISHELSHLLLSHHKISLENSYKIKYLQDEIEKLEKVFKSSSNTQYYSRNFKNLINNIYIAQRKIELKADVLALELILKAGYNLDLALEVFDYLDDDYNFLENKNIYPMIYERKENILLENEFLNQERLKQIGKNNLLKNEALTVKRSCDKETLVINKPKNYKEFKFDIDKFEDEKFQYILKDANDFYKKFEIDNAIKFFTRANEIKPNSFIPSLYLSYCYEIKYKKENKNSYLKLAKKYIKTAKKLNAQNEYVINQYKKFYKR